MDKKSRERMKDMCSLMEDGYGKSVVCFDDMLNTGLSVSHSGGTTAITKATSAWIEIMMSVAKVTLGLRIAIDTFASDLDISNVKTSDMIKVDIRYMESSNEAGFRLEIKAGKTGVSRLDSLIESVLPMILTKEANTLSVI